jgi:hypothetical protein
MPSSTFYSLAIDHCYALRRFVTLLHVIILSSVLLHTPSYLIPLFLFFLLISLEAWRFLLIWGLEQTKSLAVPPFTLSSENENLVNVFLLFHHSKLVILSSSF